MPSYESSLPPRSPGDDLVAGSPAGCAPVSSGPPIVVIAAWAGATMLAGQIAWIRLAAAEVGCNLSAVVVLLAAAMIGLSVGSRIVARRIERTAIGRRLIVQQLAAALVLLVSPVVIKGVGGLAAAAAGARGWHYWPAEMFALGAVALTILLFNVPFGMLLPLAVELDAKHRFRSLSRQVGLLGGVQLAGAAAGGVVLGLLVPMWVGFDQMLLLAGLVQVLLAAWSIAAILRRPALRPPAVADGDATPLSEPRTIRRLAGLLGLLSLAAMLVWLRALSFYLGTSIHTFVLTAAMLVGGLAVGGWISAAVAPRQRRPGQFLAGVLLFAAVLLALAGFWADMAPALLPWVLPSALPSSLPSAMPPSHAASPFAEILGRIVVIFVMIGPPAVLIGSTLPLLLRLAAPVGSAANWPAGRAGRIVARIVASYTFGGALGAVIAFAGFLQLMDGRSALLAVAVGHMVAALWAEVLDPAIGWHRSTARAAQPDDEAGEPGTHTHTRRRRLHAATRKRIPWLNMVLFVVAAAACIWQAGQGSLFRKAYLPAGSAVISEDELPKAMLAEGYDRPVAVGLAIDESRGGVVATRRNCATGRLELLVGLETIADDSPQSIYVQRTQGLLPLLLAPADHPRRALVVGLGSGASVAPLVQAGVERITVAEPFEAVTECALGDITRPNFAQANDNLRDRRTVEFSPEAPASESAAKSAATSKPTTAPAAATTRPDAGVEVRVIGSDGRSVLRFEPGGWQIILVNPTDPSAFGAGVLFSKEFYRLAYERLADDGIFVQWLPLWRMSRAEEYAVVLAFVDEFQGWSGEYYASHSGFLLPGEVDLPGQTRPMLALIGTRIQVHPNNHQIVGRIVQLRSKVDRVTSLNRPSLRELGFNSPGGVFGGLVDILSAARLGQSYLPGSPFDGPSYQPTDERPLTELSPPTNGIPRLSFSLYHLGMGVPKAIGKAVGSWESELGEKIKGVVKGRCLLGQAVELAAGGEQGPPIREKLAAATQADPENAFARLSLDQLDCDAELARIRAARKDKKLTDAQAIAELSAAAKRFPLDVTALWMKFALVQESNAKDASNALEEILGRAPNSSAAHFWKARLLSAQVAGDLSAGRFAEAAKKAQQANNEKANARALRSGETPADSALGDTIRGQVAAAAKGLAASQPAGK